MHCHTCPPGELRARRKLNKKAPKYKRKLGAFKAED